ncbi:MAG: class I SAM-dependent methyltransferase [Theionarchaea archaeon]|nr:class I SAM-dependent methyltransferase [Theionarchaea archaeon]MBU7038959.1 class I SAM-dependent methyltransferase [Theionarchaea archaeon]
MEHYFTHRPTSEEKVNEITERIRGHQLRFKTSRGVFSRQRVDFGTKLLTESVSVSSEDWFLDVGCGYGVIGITLSFLCRYAVLLDVNERACRLARKNILLNERENAGVICGTPTCVRPGFDVIAMNPPIRAGKQAVFNLIAQGKQLLNVGGTMYVVARTKQGAKSIFSYLEEEFPHVVYVALKGGYRVMAATRENPDDSVISPVKG